MTRASDPTLHGWTTFWSRLLPTRRPAAARPARDHANSDRLLEAMSPHELADLPAFHEAA